ncbi:hypothetical protein F7Q99_28495 [Streptomyces kaniharaensis]|uniref:Uncharacterized protein n=1 Tax=Streptomyces kaniharaensis TaxID=212423 RepID=A0A6N7L1L1_9ACTN|nr:hypothetical protein [Streptomyces kaniharaensis]MQS16074.1 hypothetical protein [Streptomyces kaniharaensis]
MIGEQQDRVEYAAKRFGAETYPGLTAEQAGLPEGSAELKAAQLEHNHAWINQMKDEGRLIIDTGPAEPREHYPEPTRRRDWPEAPYEMELGAIENFPNVIRPWENMTGAPNFPWKYDSSTYQMDDVAARQEQDILRKQGNTDGAEDIEKAIAGLPVSDAIKEDAQAYLDSLDKAVSDPVDTPPTDIDDRLPIQPDARADAPWTLTVNGPEDFPDVIREQLNDNDLVGMQFPVEVVHRPAEANERWDSYSNFNWESAEDRSMAEIIVAARQEQDILREQGNMQGAEDIEKAIAGLPVSDAIKEDAQGYLDGLLKRSEVHVRADEYKEKYPRSLRWFGSSAEMADDSLIGARDNILQTSGGQQLSRVEMTDIIDALQAIDAVEGFALRRDFYGTDGKRPIDYYSSDAKNARVSITFDEGASITYIASEVAPQPEFGGPDHPGGRDQKRLLAFDGRQAWVDVRPLGADISFDDKDRPETYTYPDRSPQAGGKRP